MKNTEEEERGFRIEKGEYVFSGAKQAKAG